MRQITQWTIAIGILLLTGLAPPSTFAQIILARGHAVEVLPPVVPHVVIPPLVRFTGILLPYNAQNRGGFHTLTVIAGPQKWLFQLDNVETLSEPQTGEMILNDIFPPVLHLTGPEYLLQVLQTAETTKTPVTVEGRLYISDRMLAVTAANEGAANSG